MKFNNDDIIYYDYIFGKSVIVVGAGKDAVLSINKLNKYDLICFTGNTWTMVDIKKLKVPFIIYHTFLEAAPGFEEIINKAAAVTLSIPYYIVPEKYKAVNVRCINGFIFERLCNIAGGVPYTGCLAIFELSFFAKSIQTTGIDNFKHTQTYKDANYVSTQSYNTKPWTRAGSAKALSYMRYHLGNITFGNELNYLKSYKPKPFVQ